jgi:putative MATE family efflux protein
MESNSFINRFQYFDFIRGSTLAVEEKLMSISTTPAPAAKVAPILRLGAPLISFFLLQSAISLIILAFLGRLGTATVAGIGVSGALYGVVLALLYGFDTGVQALVSRATGAGRRDLIGQIIAEAQIVSVPLGIALTAVVWTLAPTLMAGVIHDRAAASAGAAYLQSGALSLALLALTIPINAAWIASGRPGISFLVSAITAPIQIGLTFMLVFGAGAIPALGINGAGWANVLSCVAGALLQYGLIARLQLVTTWKPPTLDGALRIVAIGWPVSLQQSFQNFGLMVAFVIVAQIGVAGTAVINVLINLTTAPIQCAAGLSVAAATLVGQALGRGNPAEARTWGWRTVGINLALTAPLGLFAAISPHPLLAIFLHDPATLALADLPARILGLTVVADTTRSVLAFAFRGAGATKIAAGILFAGLWLVELPLIWWVALKLGQGVLGVIEVQATIAVSEALLLAWLWRTSIWTLRPEGSGASLAGAKRIAILGGGGAGKSTLARRLGASLQLPVTHLDRLVYGPGWTRRAPGDVAAALTAELEDTVGWIVEGTYYETSAVTLPRADVVLWLDQPTSRRLYRCWRKVRDHRGKPRADRPDDCEEAFGWTYASSVLTFGRWSGRLERQLSAAAAGTVVRVWGDRGIRRLLADAGVQPQVSLAPIRRAATGEVRGSGGPGRSVACP